MSLYLHLFHGRRQSDEQLEDWGFAGPTFGPLASANSTYGDPPRLQFTDASEGYFTYHEDLIYYDGAYYGDWSLFDSADWQTTQPFCQREAILPGLPCPPDPVPPDPVPPEHEGGTVRARVLKASLCDSVDAALIDCLDRLRSQQSLGQENDDLIQHGLTALAMKHGPFDPTACWDSVIQCVLRCEATPFPVVSLAEVIKHNLLAREFGFCTDLIAEWEARPVLLSHLI